MPLPTPAETMQAALADIPFITQPTAHEIDEIVTLLENNGFRALLGMLLAERQGYYQQLTIAQLGDENLRHHASVTQGKILGLDRVAQTMVEMLEHAQKPDPETEESE